METLQLDKTRFHFIWRGAVVGVIAGFVISLFRLCIENMLKIVKIVFSAGFEKPIWMLLLFLFFIVAWLVNAKFIKDEPNISGSGIPQVEGQLEGELELSWKSIFFRKWIGGVLSIGSGLFLGREGPSIQLGAAVGQGFGEKTKLKGTGLRVMIAGGAAAGLSSAFNAPIAASLFVTEEIYHNFSPLIWTTALSASVTANLVSLYFFGMTPVLHMAYSHTLPLWQYFHLIILGIFLGLLGLVYDKFTLGVPKVYSKIFKFPRWFHGIIPLIILVPIGLLFPSTLGGGNSLIISLGSHPTATTIFLGLFILRLLFSTVSFGSGLPGGIFLPILSLGAILGGLYGSFMADIGLMPRIYVVNFIIYAMAGYFACISKAPFTAILLVTEMVGSIKHLMPLAVVALVAYMVVDLLRGEPIYAAMLDNILKKSKNSKIHGDFKDRLEIPVFVGSFLQDKQVRDINWPKESLLISIRRGEKELLPHGDTVIRSGDTLVVLVSHSERSRIRKAIDANAFEQNNN